MKTDMSTEDQITFRSIPSIVSVKTLTGQKCLGNIMEMNKEIGNLFLKHFETLVEIGKKILK